MATLAMEEVDVIPPKQDHSLLRKAKRIVKYIDKEEKPIREKVTTRRRVVCPRLFINPNLGWLNENNMYRW